MPSQIFIIPPKASRGHKPLAVTNSEQSTRDDKVSHSVPDTPMSVPTLSSSDNKLSSFKVIPSVRISPPQQIVDSLLDWDDDDRYFGRPSTIIRHRRQRQFQEKLARIQEGVVQSQSSTVSAIVSAPVVEAPNGQTTTNATDHPTATSPTTLKQEGSLETGEIQGQTLLHLAAKLGHEEIMRVLINETSQASMLSNARGQTPLLCAIEAGSTSTATLLMEQDPLSLACKDNIGSSVFHYATEQCNDIILSRAISLLKRLSSSNARGTVCNHFFSSNSYIIFSRLFNDLSRKMLMEKLHLVLPLKKVH